MRNPQLTGAQLTGKRVFRQNKNTCPRALRTGVFIFIAAQYHFAETAAVVSSEFTGSSHSAY